MRYWRLLTTAFLLAWIVPNAQAIAQRTADLEARQAINAGLKLVQGAASRYPEHRECFACHHQTLPMLAMTVANGQGQTIDEALMQSQGEFTLTSFAEKRDVMKQGKGVGGGAMTVGYGLWALELANRPKDETTDAMVTFLLATQQKDGHWSTGNRPPLEESAIACTVIAAQGLSRFAQGEQKTAAEAATRRALVWASKAPVKVQEDRNFRLMARVRLGSDRAEIEQAIAAVASSQRSDGGWASRDDLTSEPYATGQSLYALALAGVPSSHPSVARGSGFLLKSRKPDGSWLQETRSKPIQTYFDNGDPHGKHQFISTPATAWAVVGLTALLGSQASRPTVDLLIEGGRIVDGTGNPWFEGDVGIQGDRVAFVGRRPEGLKVGRTIDARGLVVSPGFIDIHSHSDTPLLEDGAGLSKLYQGVTTEVLGEDSSGGPAKGKKAKGKFAREGKPALEWTTLGGYLDAVGQSGTAVNVASYVGLGTLLDCVLGDALARPTPTQLEELKALLDEAMQEGALGLSTMLAGARELNVTTDDLVALCEVVRKHGGIFSSHIRNEGTEVFQAIDEAIAVGERARVPVDIIHLKIADQSLWGRMDEIVARINAARARGVNAQSNVYPYTRGNNDLVTILPPWAHEGGTSALLNRLDDPAQRARIKADIQSGLPGWYDHYTAVGGDWSRMLISAKLSAKNAGFQGKTMDVVLAVRAKSQPGREPLDLFLDFLAEERGSVSTIYAHHTEDDMNLALVQPWCSIGSDGLALATTGVLRRGHPHPRSFGTFPRILSVYVRQRHLLTIEDAIRKMTSLNAAKVHLKDRGLLRAGSFADVTVFDPKTILDRSTFLEPFQYSEGVRYVVVNGGLALEGGKPTSARTGRPLQRGQ